MREQGLKRSVLLRVEHHANLGAESSGGEVASEGGADDAGVSVLGDDLAPPDSISCVVLHSFGLVDVGNLLSKVELSVFSLVDALESEQVLGLVLVPLAASESSEDSLGVQSARESKSTLTSRAGSSSEPSSIAFRPWQQL